MRRYQVRPRLPLEGRRSQVQLLKARHYFVQLFSDDHFLRESL